MQKDLPLLRSVMPLEFSAVLVKGRGNYLSLRRLDNALSRAASLFSDDEEFEQLRRLRAWSKETADGSLSDLDFRPLPAVWDEVASDHGNCMGRSCPMYAKCFYYKARRRMQNAQILVVNHALFFTDLALRRENVSILPKYDVVIFDEAHTIEAVAGDHLGLSITNGQVEYTLRKLYNDRTNRGLLVHHKLGDAQKAGVGVPRPGRAISSRASPRWLDRSSRKRQRPACRRAGHRRQPAERAAAQAGRHAAAPRQARSSKPEERQDFTAAANRLEALAQGIDDWLGQQMPDSVYWIERSFEPQPLADHAGGRADRRGTGPPRAPLRQGAHRGHDQRHAGHRRRRNRRSSSSIADRAARSSLRTPHRSCPAQRNYRYTPRRSGWAARSTTAARPRSCCPTACPTRAATARATSGWRST